MQAGLAALLGIEMSSHFSTSSSSCICVRLFVPLNTMYCAPESGPLCLSSRLQIGYPETDLRGIAIIVSHLRHIIFEANTDISVLMLTRLCTRSSVCKCAIVTGNLTPHAASLVVIILMKYAQCKQLHKAILKRDL